jgi:hypothetical protein
MLIDMYQQPLCQPVQSRDKKQPFTKSRQAEVQASYYLRRGWFQNKKRVLFKLLSLDAKQFAHIETIAELDAFSKQYLMDNYHLEIPIRQTLFLMKCVKHQTASPANGLLSQPKVDPIITDPQINEPIEGVAESNQPIQD